MLTNMFPKNNNLASGSTPSAKHILRSTKTSSYTTYYEIVFYILINILILFRNHSKSC